MASSRRGMLSRYIIDVWYGTEDLTRKDLTRMAIMLSQPEDDRARRPRWRGFVGLAACFAGLCTVFLLVVTAAEAWREHVQAQWPEATARVQRCAVEYYRESAGGGSEGYFISCRVTYPAGAEAIVATIRSGRVLSPAWPDPSAKIEWLNNWVDTHPPGTPIAVHYNPPATRTPSW